MNTLKNTILSTKEAKAKLDHTVKQIFSNRQILARIIKRTVPEFADIRLKDIEETYIEPGSNTISSVAVERNLTNIEGLNTEDTSSNEGTIYYDLLFKAAYPGKEGQMIGMDINIELQNDYYPPYPLESRAAFYAARRLCSQLPHLTGGTNYGALQKVYSIWICMGNVPAKDADTITLYRFQKYDILNHIEVRRETYDLINFIMIRFNDRSAADDDLIRLLQTICSNTLSSSQKLKRLQESGIRVTDEIRDEVNTMCNYGDMIENQGIHTGIQRGIRQGAVNIALKMLKNEESLEKIHEYTEFPIDELLKLAADHGINVKTFA